MYTNYKIHFSRYTTHVHQVHSTLFLVHFYMSYMVNLSLKISTFQAPWIYQTQERCTLLPVHMYEYKYAQVHGKLLSLHMFIKYTNLKNIGYIRHTYIVHCTSSTKYTSQATHVHQINWPKEPGTPAAAPSPCIPLEVYLRVLGLFLRVDWRGIISYIYI